MSPESDALAAFRRLIAAGRDVAVDALTEIEAAECALFGGYGLDRQPTALTARVKEFAQQIDGQARRITQLEDSFGAPHPASGDAVADFFVAN